MKRIGLTVLIVVLLLAVLILCRFLYLDRFVRYENGAAVFDFEQTLAPSGVEKKEIDPSQYPFETILAPSASEIEAASAAARLSGYYISTNMLAKDLEAVQAALRSDNDYNAVVIDVKSVYGNFYYSSKLTGAQTATADIEAIDKLIAQLCAKQGLTVIARVPAFSDPNYALAHQSQGLPLYSGALWTDDNGCYWMNPYSNDVQGWLVSIALELEGLGFDEVLFDQFYFPDSDRIAWNSPDVTRQEAVLDAANNIIASLSGSKILPCFGSTDPQIAEMAHRIFVTSTDAADVAQTTEALADAIVDPVRQIVFFTASRDTRYQQCGVIHPLLEES